MLRMIRLDFKRGWKNGQWIFARDIADMLMKRACIPVEAIPH
jgi:hypothetical protein